MRSFLRPSFGLNGIDRTVAKIINKRYGYFVEIGANDGINESNTLLLEQHYGWRGLLIEPVPEMYQRCCRNRPNAVVVNCACLDPQRCKDEEIRMTACDQFSFVSDLMPSGDRDALLELSQKCQPGVVPHDVRVPCKTLSSVLSEQSIGVIDLLSLDVEGSEVELLKGLDPIHWPNWILVEINRSSLDLILKELKGEYDVVDTYFEKDALLKLRSINSSGKLR